MANELPLKPVNWKDIKDRFIQQAEIVDINIEIFKVQAKNTKFMLDIADKEIELLKLKIKDVEESINEMINDLEVNTPTKEALMLIAKKLDITVNYNSDEEN